MINDKTKKNIIYLLVGLLFIALGLSSFIMTIVEDINDKRKYADTSVVVIDGEEYVPNEGVNFLLMGVDKYGGFADDDDFALYNMQSADFLAILSINEETKEYTIFHINRDTMVKYDLIGVGGYKYGTTVEQICLSHAQGNGGSVSAKNTVKAVKTYFSQAITLGSIRIDYYIAFTMDIMPIIVDDVMDSITGKKGVGLTVTLDEGQSLAGLDLPNSTLNGNELTLHGTDALWFVRGRHYVDDSTNIARMRRQRQFMDAFMNALSSNEIDEFKLLSCYTLLTETEHLTTDASSQKLHDFFKYLTESDENGEKLYRFTDVVTPAGEAKLGEMYMEFYPDTEDLKRLTIQVFLHKKEG